MAPVGSPADRQRSPAAASSEIWRQEIQQRLHDPSLVLVDALPADSYAEGHIPGARSLPAAEIVTRAGEVLPDRHGEIAVYCAKVTCPAAGRAIEQLRALGYTHLRHYRGGLADWTEGGGELESVAPAEPVAPLPAPRPTATRSLPAPSWSAALLAFIERQSTAQLFGCWLAMIVTCSVLYWLAGLWAHDGLIAGGQPVEMNARGLATAVYFSFVTATSVGYGDVLPLGVARVVAVAEAVSGLLIFGAVVAKFVSRRQDELVREIHRVTFEERLDRVQTNLHLVLSEIQAIAAMCEDGAVRLERVGPRLESAALVFAGELRAIHDLLYRPQWAPEEPVLSAILASLASSLRELSELLVCMPAGFARSATLQDTLRTLARLADEVCGECVPHTYAPSLRMWMDRIQETARRIA